MGQGRFGAACLVSAGAARSIADRLSAEVESLSHGIVLYRSPSAVRSRGGRALTASLDEDLAHGSEAPLVLVVDLENEEEPVVLTTERAGRGFTTRFRDPGPNHMLFVEPQSTTPVTAE